MDFLFGRSKAKNIDFMREVNNAHKERKIDKIIKNEEIEKSELVSLKIEINEMKNTILSLQEKYSHLEKKISKLDDDKN